MASTIQVLVMLVLTLGATFLVFWRLENSVLAQGKDSCVGGNSLMFTCYPVLNGTELANCSASSAAVPLTTGSDVINLTAPGETGYICMKLINVSSAADAPLPGSMSSSSSGPSKSHVLMIDVMTAAAYSLIIAHPLRN